MATDVLGDRLRAAREGYGISLRELARRVGEPRVALSGGCFQNRLLTAAALRGLEGAGFEVLLHRRVPANDGGISLGQIAVAAARLDRETNKED